MPRAPKTSRALAYSKCQRCRSDKAKCLPKTRLWPGPRCDRCERCNYACSENRTKAEEFSTLVQSANALSENSSNSSLPRSPSPSTTLQDSLSRKTDNELITEYGDIRRLGVYDSDFLCFLEVDQYKIDLEDHIHRRIADHFGKGRTQESLYVREQLHKAQVLELLSQRKPCIEEPSWVSVTLTRSNIDLAESCELSGNLFGAELFLEDYLALFEAQEVTFITADAARDIVRIVQQLTRLYGLSKKRIEKLKAYFDLPFPSLDLPSSFILDRAARIDSDKLWVRLKEDGVIDRKMFAGSALHTAAKHDACNLARFVLDAGVDVNARVSYRSGTALHEAIDHRHTDLVKLLITGGACIEAENWNSDTPLHRAASGKDDVSLVVYLLWKGARIEAPDHQKRTPLNRAVSVGNLDIVRCLLEKGADVNAGPRDLLSLHTAANRGASDIVKLLLEHGADVAIRDGTDHTALHFAAQRGHGDIVKLLLEYGGDVTAQNDEGDTALHLAAQRGHGDILKMLLGYGGDITAQNDEGDTALHFAVNPQEVTPCPGHRDCIDTLLDRGLPVDARGRYMETPLHRASSLHEPDIVKWLLQRGASVMAEADKGTPLHYAIHRQRSCGTVLAEADNMYQQRSFGDPSKACQVMKLLLGSGAVVNFRRKSDGKTPLHLAGECVKKEELMGLTFLVTLLHYGGDAQIIDESNMTAIDYSRPNQAALDLIADHRRGSTT